MKKFLFIILSLIAASVYAVPLPEGTDARITSVKQDGGKIVYVRLSEKTSINTPVGVITVSDEVRFNKEGQVIECEPTVSGEIETPLGKLKYDRERKLSFYDSGCVKQIYMYPSQNITSAVGTFNVASGWFSLYDNYVPKEFTLNSNIQFKLPSGTIEASSNKITFNPDGTIHSFFVKETSPLQTSIGKVYPERYSQLILYQDGSIESVTSEDICMVTVSDSLIFSTAGTRINYNEAGNVNRFVSDADEVTLNGFEIKFNDSYNKYFYVLEDNSIVILPYNSDYSRSLYFSIGSQKFYEPYGVYITADGKFICMWKSGNNGIEVEVYNLDKSGNPVLKTRTPLDVPYYYYDYSMDSYLNLFYNKPFELDENGNITAYSKKTVKEETNSDGYYEFIYNFVHLK